MVIFVEAVILDKQMYFYDSAEIDDFCNAIKEKKILIVSGERCKKLSVVKSIIGKIQNVCYFSDFSPNPTYESVVKGVDVFKRNNCDAVLAIGGGSAMDVAKCIKLFSTMKDDENYLIQPFMENGIPLYVVPTTSGTGSEATKFAVIYYNGLKQSVMHESIIPSVVLLEPNVLENVPEYQKKVTMLDALCHAIESFWSVNSTEQSRLYSKKALEIIFANMESYLNNEFSGNKNMLSAANIAGRAINISQTTAAHAMCYKITSMYGIAHGHAAAIVLPKIWRYMLYNTDNCIDSRGKIYVESIFKEIALAMKCDTVEGAISKIEKLLENLEIHSPKVEKKDLDEMILSINIERLKNNPIRLKKENIKEIYIKVFEK